MDSGPSCKLERGTASSPFYLFAASRRISGFGKPTNQPTPPPALGANIKQRRVRLVVKNVFFKLTA